MNNEKTNLQMMKKLMLRLLPVQILSAMIAVINVLVSGYFASNFIGVEAMSAIGLYSPILFFTGALSALVSGGCAMMCGKLLGANEQEDLQQLFSMALQLAVILGIGMSVVLILIQILDLTWIFSASRQSSGVFNRYMIYQITGLIPQIAGSVLSVFLSLENRKGRLASASISYVLANVILNYLFIEVLEFEEVGLALASSLSMWIFTVIELGYFLSEGSLLKIKRVRYTLSDVRKLASSGSSAALDQFFLAIRSAIVNRLLELYVGNAGLSAFTAALNVMDVFMCVPVGLLAVNRLLITVSYGEQDRKTLVSIMKIVLRQYVPLMLVLSFIVVGAADPIASAFFARMSLEALTMMKTSLRIMAFMMPLYCAITHFTCYLQTSGRDLFETSVSAMEGFIWTSLFSWLLVSRFKISGVAFAHVLTGAADVAVIICYSWIKRRRLPRSVEDVMVIPEDFGVSDDDRIDVSVNNMKDVVTVSEKIIEFCLSKGIDRRRSNLAALALEEMAGNVLEYGMGKDNLEHSIDIRVVFENDSLLLRIRDDYEPFDPEARSRIVDKDDPAKNVGIRLIYRIMKDITYQNILGLNVLTIRI